MQPPLYIRHLRIKRLSAGKGGKLSFLAPIEMIIYFFGAVGAIIGVTVALSISPTMLNIVLLLVMALTIYSIFTSKPSK